MGVESYLHKYAKVVVCSWLRKKIRLGKNFKGLNNLDICLIDDAKSPMFNVFDEYPVCMCSDIDDNVIIGVDVLWDVWLQENNLLDKIKSRNKIPTKFELDQLKDKLKCITIFDIGIIDQGKLKYVIEIKHTHPCTPKKIKFIKEHNLIGYELDAQKIMEQVKLPYTAPIENEWKE